MTEKKETIESKLVPALRQGIDIIKMVLFKELKPHLEKQYPKMAIDDINRLAGAIVNTLFGIENLDKTIAGFIRSNEPVIKTEVAGIASNFDHLRIPLTDALRIQYLCDSQEGIDSETVLERAREANILIEDRDVRLPGAFMSIVRSFGIAYKILAPMKTE